MGCKKEVGLNDVRADLDYVGVGLITFPKLEVMKGTLTGSAASHRYTHYSRLGTIPT